MNKIFVMIKCSFKPMDLILLMGFTRLFVPKFIFFVLKSLCTNCSG